MALRFDKKSLKSWTWILLIVSLGANAFFAGEKVTDAIRHWHKSDDSPRAVRTELRWLKDRLSPGAVASIEDALQPIKPDIVMRINKLKALRAELDQIVASPTPDKAAIDAHLREIRIEVGAMQEQVQSRTFEALLALPPNERAALAKDDN